MGFEMLKKRIEIEGGRYLIYYSFRDVAPEDSPASKKAERKSHPDAKGDKARSKGSSGV